MASKEVALLRAILNQGVEQGVFEIRDTNSVAVVITQVIAGLDVPYIRDNLSENKIDKEALKTILGQLLLFGITGRGEGDNPI